MSVLTHRSDIVFNLLSDSHLTVQAGTVTAYAPGGVVASTSNGNTITLYSGHGFAVDDKWMKGTDPTTFSGIYKVASVNGNVLTISTSGTASVTVGDTLINLGTDTATSTPNYGGSTVTIYSTPDTTTAISLSKVTLSATGGFEYWHKGLYLWELIRGGDGVPIGFNKDAGIQYTPTVLNVKDYGATGDGTTDDTVAIQAALTAVPSTGAKVYIPAGVYITSTTLFIKSYTSLVGDGIGATVIKRKSGTQTNSSTSVNGPILSAGSAVATYYDAGSPGYSISVFDLTLDGNYSNQTATTATISGFNGIRFGKGLVGTPYGNIDGVTIQRVEAKNHLNSGIYTTNAKNVLIDSCITYKTGQLVSVAEKNGISVGGDHNQNAAGWNANVVISNNRVSYSGVLPYVDAGSRASEGIATGDQDNVIISGNDISHVDVGIELNNSDTSEVLYNYAISGNTIHDCVESVLGGYGITMSSIDNTSRYSNVSIVGNSFYNLNTSAMSLVRIYGLTVSGNTAYGTNLLAITNADRAFTILGCHGGTVTGNSAVFVGAVTNASGIIIQGLAGTDTTTEISVVGNSVKDAGATGFGLWLDGGATSILMASNRITGGNYGVRIAATGTNSGNVIVGNDITGYATAAYIDQSGQTNYYYGDLSAGAFTVPGVLTATGAATLSSTLAVTSHATVSGQLRKSVAAAVTASVTHTQVGATALTADINNVSVCANVDDAVALPTAVAGMDVTVINNGAQSLRIWPASGDNLGTGVDTVRAALTAGSNVRFVSYDATNWEEV